MADDLIVAAALIDTLVFADGRSARDVPGGAGLYALSGAALFGDHAVLVTGTGEDIDQGFGPWLDRNRLSRKGLRFADPKTPRNMLRYLADQTRTETPVYGEDHFRRIEPAPGDIARLIGEARSLYIFRNADPAFWRPVNAAREGHDAVTLWEIGLDACRPEQRERIAALCGTVDALSLNMREAGLIFGTTDRADILAGLALWPVPVVFLRDGKSGSHVIAEGAACFVPSLAVDPVDETGAGNAYSGAALIGLAEGRSPLEAAAMGTVAAATAIAQLGLPEPCSASARTTAKDAFASLAGQFRKDISA